MNESKSLPFEACLKEMEKIVADLERGQLPLEEQLKIFEKGVELSRRCLAQLEEIEKKVELLTVQTDGTLATTPFSEKTEANA